MFCVRDCKNWSGHVCFEGRADLPSGCHTATRGDSQADDRHPTCLQYTTRIFPHLSSNSSTPHLFHSAVSPAHLSKYGDFLFLAPDVSRGRLVLPPQLSRSKEAKSVEAELAGGQVRGNDRMALPSPPNSVNGGGQNEPGKCLKEETGGKNRTRGLL